MIDSDKIIFHVDEAMSWESVRDLLQMKKTLLLIENIIKQSNSPEEVIEWVEDVRTSLDDTFSAIAEGEAI